VLKSSSTDASRAVSNGDVGRRRKQRRQVSLHSLLEALPAASVDTGQLMESSGNGGGAVVRRTSLSSISLDSRCSDFESYFYI